MAISVLIDTLDDDEEGGYYIRKFEGTARDFTNDMNSNKGVYLGTDAFIPLSRITSLWFDEAEEESDFIGVDPKPALGLVH